jgi:hypothetical protein
VEGKGNTDLEFTTFNPRADLIIQNMEVEEAVVVGLLAVGMSILIALTIMLFW